MPELPEVETVLRTLESKIRDLEIKDIEIIYPNIVSCDLNEFKKKLIGQHFRNFKRRGKYLLFEMDDITLVSHLRMEGKYYILDKDYPRDKHTHVIFTLSDGKELRYHDVRKFGRMELIPKEDEYLDFKDLGLEPFSQYLNEKYCEEFLKDKKQPVKQVLLRQDFIAGIGNIYADEILFKCRLNPLKKACDLRKKDYRALIDATREILSEAIKMGGTTIRSYTSSLGVTGLFQQNLFVHTVDKCRICGSDIKKITVGGRGTYYCPKCQK